MKLISCRREVRTETETQIRLDETNLSEVAMKESMELAGTRVVMLTKVSGAKSMVYGNIYDEID